MQSKTKLKRINLVCVNGNLKKALRTVASIYDSNLNKAGITASQFTLLAHIQYHEKATIGFLAKNLIIDRTSLSKNLRLLERSGLIKTEIGPDKRKKFILLSALGMAKLDKAVDHWQDAQDRIYRLYGRQSVHQLLQLLYRFSGPAGKK